MISSSCLGHYPILAHARAGIGFELVRDVFPDTGDDTSKQVIEVTYGDGIIILQRAEKEGK